MSTPIKYNATAPDGAVFTRKSVKAPTHAVLTYIESEGRWGYWAWCGSLALAEKQAREARKYDFASVTIVEVSPAPLKRGDKGYPTGLANLLTPRH